MGNLIINQNFVTEEIVKELQKICPFNAFEYKDGELNINASCKNCKLCVKRGPSGVITYVEEKEVITVDKSKWVGLTVFVELEFGKVHPVVFELIGKAKELAEKINHPLYAVMIGSKEQVENNKDEILSYGVDKLFVYQDQIYEHFDIDRAFNCMKDFIEKYKPSSILYGGTSLGRAFAPKVAAHFKTGLTADCTTLGIKDNTDLVQVRPAFGGNIMAQIICTKTRPQMATVRYKIFKKPEKEVPHGEVVYMNTKHIDMKSAVKLLSVEKKEFNVDISEADVIVACGRAFKSQKDLEMAHELANLLGGVVACSRPLCEAGLMNVRYQIGLSGKTVSPKLIFVLGISGAIQFTSGMNNSDVIIAINNDPNAQIFDTAKYGIVGDVFKIVPELIKLIKEERGE